MDISTVIMTLAAVFNLVLGIFVFKKSKTQIQNYFSYFIFLITLWVISNAICYYLPKYPFANLTYFTGSILNAGIFLWVVKYSGYKVKRLWKLSVIFLSLIISIISLIPELILSTKLSKVPLGIEGELGSMFGLYAIPLCMILLISLTILIREFKRAIGLKKLKYTYVLLGFIVPIIIVFTLDFIVPILGSFYYASLDAMTSFIFVGFVAYAIFKHRFMDIRIVIRKGVVHFISLAIILFLYIYLLIFSQNFFIEQYNWPEQTTTVVLVLLIVVTIEPLRRALIKVVDRVFYSNQKDEKEEAQKLRSIMSSSLQFDKLMKKIINEFKNYLVVSEIQFIWHNKKTGNLENYYPYERKVLIEANNSLFQYLQKNPKLIVTEEIPYLIEETENGESKLLKEIEQELKQLKVGLALPIGEKDELVGILLFNKKGNKEAFTADNIQYLSQLQPQMTGAIANALLYKQAVERIQKGISNS